MKPWLLLLAVVIALVSNMPVSAQEPFYKGKIVRIITGGSAGGGLDTYSRAIARHMGKHIPGNPTFIVENMVGAGTLIAARHVYKVAKPDGLTIGSFIGGNIMGQLLGLPGYDIDFLKFGYVGSPIQDFTVCALTKASGVTSVEKWMASKTPVKLGSPPPGGDIYNNIRTLKELLGLPTQIVLGYKGTAEIRLAAESGEIAGGCWTWGNMKATWGRAIQAGVVVVMLQNRSQPHPELPAVPLAADLAKTREVRELLQVSDLSSIVFTHALPPGSPGNRLQTLRGAFMDTMKDPEFLRDTEKARIGIDPMAGDELERTIARFLRLEPALATKLKEILASK